MKHITFTLITLVLLQPASADEHWNQFRGQDGNGISSAKNLPVEFDESRNVRWKTLIPDSGWSSPVIWENEIWLTTGSDEQRELRVMCIDLESGKIVKDIKVFDMIERKVDPAYAHDSPHLNSPATPTPIVEEDRVFVHFGSQGIACLDRKTGTRIWERRDMRIYQPVRQGSSPIVDDRNLYVAYDGTDQQFFVALDKDTGKTRWQKNRNIDTDWDATLRDRGLTPKKGDGGKPGDNKKSFATATLIEVNGQRQLIAPAAEATIAYAPENGAELWRVLHPGGFNVSARPLFAHGMAYVFTSGLTGHFMAVRVDGSGDVTDTHIAWSTTKSTPHIPSPVIVDDLLFMVTDKGGIVRCLNAKTGAEFWRKRIGGNHWASPLYAAGKLYFCSKEGDVAVVDASREVPETVVKNRMNARFIASPAVGGSSLILRSTTHLYCLARGYERNKQEVAADVYPDSKVVARSADTTSGADWDAAYEQLLKRDSGVRAKVENGQTTKEDIIAWMKARAKKDGQNKETKPQDMESFVAKLKAAVRSGKMTDTEATAAYQKALASQGGKSSSKGKRRGKPGARSGSINFYAIVIGKLKSKDIELGELEIDVDYVISNGSRVKDEIIGKRVKLIGVAGQFLDNLLQIKRGETIKVRTGDYNADTQELGFGYKFQVLERTLPFKPEDFGVPPTEFRGFRGELVGQVVEAVGYEVLLEVRDVKPADSNKAADAGSIKGKRIRIAGFYNDHRDAFADLHQGDTIRVSTTHDNPTHDAIDVTNLLEKVGK
ncbi:MAG: PQQ-binding-like beta-propeller repeat protein [Fuerstiella sp.]